MARPPIDRLALTEQYGPHPNYVPAGGWDRAAQRAPDKLVKKRIIEGTHDDVQRMPVERVREGRKLPCAEMSSQKQHAFAASQRALVVLESLIDDDLADVLARVSRKEAHFGHMSSQ